MSIQYFSLLWESHHLIVISTPFGNCVSCRSVYLTYKFANTYYIAISILILPFTPQFIYIRQVLVTYRLYPFRLRLDCDCRHTIAIFQYTFYNALVASVILCEAVGCTLPVFAPNSCRFSVYQKLIPSQMSCCCVSVALSSCVIIIRDALNTFSSSYLVIGGECGGLICYYLNLAIHIDNFITLG